MEQLLLMNHLQELCANFGMKEKTIKMIAKEVEAEVIERFSNPNK